MKPEQPVPCRNCGKLPEQADQFSSYQSFFEVWCPGCGGNQMASTRALAIERWNTANRGK